MSAEPDFELTDLLPCFAIFIPQLAATNEAAVDIFNVSDISPPVPHVSTVLTEEEIFIDFDLIIFVAPNISSLVSPNANKYIKISMNITAFLASLVFFKAGFDATMLYYRLGQMMELELDIPIWWMYLSFPVGFVILALFSIEMTIQSILDARKIHKETI